MFVGDIQGCRPELERLLKKVRFDPDEDTLLPVGDLVNRGPDSLGTLRLLRELDARPVIGNHDLALLASVRGERSGDGRDTLAPILAAKDRDELVDWVAEQPFVRAFDDVVMVHAGFAPQWKDPIAKLERADAWEPSEAAQFAVRVRTCTKKGRLPAKGEDPAAPPFAPWHRLFDRARVGGREVVFGHWAVQGLFQRGGYHGLDSGCVWGGALTAWIPEEERTVQVRAKRAYAAVR